MNLFGYLAYISSLEDQQITFQSNTEFYLRFQESQTMTNKQNISKTINFEQVTMSVVPPQSSHRPLPIILDIIDLWRVAYLYQPCLHHLKPKCLVLLRLVLCQGVVHVEPVELDLLQQQGTIDKDPKINMMTFLLVSTKGEMRVIRGGK